MCEKINKYLDFNMFGYQNEIVQTDLQEMSSTPIEWGKLDNKTILITGANAMLATYVVYLLMYLIQHKGLHIHVIALARNMKKASDLFADFIEDKHFELCLQDVCESIAYDGHIDYIFHFAGNASPYFIKHEPVDILKSNLLGTINVLELARQKQSSKVIFASTREVYGENKEIQLLSETSFGNIDCLDARSCYPESKRAAETLCKSYFVQYGVPFNAVRIAHSYGPGMKLSNDGRVMADLLHYALSGKDIVLKSTGEALRAFCYINDTVIGMMYILLYGKDAEAYNLSNETEEISILSLAHMLIKHAPKQGLQVKIEIPQQTENIYCNYARIGLDTSKLESLGWQPKVTLEDGIGRVINSNLE